MIIEQARQKLGSHYNTNDSRSFTLSRLYSLRASMLEYLQLSIMGSPTHYSLFSPLRGITLSANPFHPAFFSGFFFSTD